MKFDKNSAKNLDKREANKILFKSGLYYYIIGGICLILGIILLILKNDGPSIIFFISSIVLSIIGIKNMFLSGEKKERVLTSKLVDIAIKHEKEKGNSLTKDDIDKIKFEYDPIFHDKIVAQVHKMQDEEYDTNVKNAEINVEKLESLRTNEIKRIADERWQSIGNNYLKYNLTEGKILINQTEHLFTSIKGAEVKKEESYRVVTVEYGKSKKHVSLGKAVVGGVLLGPLGAIAGGAMGKTTSNGNSVSDSIPTCNHIGVIVDIDGFKTEIVLLDNTVDQSTNIYKEALQNAEEIVSKLHYLATQPVPKTFTKVENEQSVLDIDKQIKEARQKLEDAKDDKPTYEIPERYLKK